MRVVVTEEHIARGQRHLGAACPVALAFKALGFPNALVAISRVTLAPCTRWHPLPVAASNFVVQFDSGSAVKPFEFELDIAADR